MPTLAKPPPLLRTAFVAGLVATSQAQGTEGRALRNTAEKIMRHWNERAEQLLLLDEQGDEASYLSVPARPAFVAKVRYRHAGTLKPLPWTFDE